MLNLEESISRIRQLTSKQKVIVASIRGKLEMCNNNIEEQIGELNDIVNEIISILNMHNQPLNIENKEVKDV